MVMDSSNDVVLGSPEMEKFLCDLLLDSSQPISKRFRALLTMPLFLVFVAATRDLWNLLGHEAAFALSQMMELEVVPALASVLNDLSLHPIVPGVLTDLRSASLNNDNFGQVAVRQNLHQHLLHSSGVLMSQILEYVKVISESDPKSLPTAKAPKNLAFKRCW